MGDDIKVECVEVVGVRLGIVRTWLLGELQEVLEASDSLQSISKDYTRLVEGG